MKEIVLTEGKKEATIETIYFGGGTPSLLKTEELGDIILLLKDSFDISSEAEWSLEANPDDVTREKVLDWKGKGINRLSIGIQSFRDEDLVWMNRSHTAMQAMDCVRSAQDAGIGNISVDLIFGTPGLDNASWQANIERALALSVPHLSCYALTVESKTALNTMIRQQKKEAPDADLQAEQYLLLIDMMEQSGYDHYEISSFALPGMHSRHNTSYWNGEHYFGFGPSAHSFNGDSRTWNIANNAAYIRSLDADRIPSESEKLTEKQQLNEYVMTAIRTAAGIDLDRVGSRWGENQKERILRASATYIASGKALHTNNHIRLTRSGKLFADGIAAELFED